MGSVASIFVTNAWGMVLVAIAIPIIFYLGDKCIKSLWQLMQIWWYVPSPVTPISWKGPGGRGADECCPLLDYRIRDNIFLSLICPITHDLMMEPVQISCGHIFEEQAIRNFVIRQSVNKVVCPVCNQHFAPNPNYRRIDMDLRELIEEIALNYGLSKE